MRKKSQGTGDIKAESLHTSVRSLMEKKDPEKTEETSSRVGVPGRAVLN